MKRTVLLCIALIGFISVPGCRSDAPPPDVPSAQTPSPVTVTPIVGTTDEMHIVVATQGSIQVQREGWSSSAPILMGTRLRYGDLLQADDVGQVTIVCADLSVSIVQQGIHPVPCTTSTARKAWRTRDGDMINVTRSGPCGEFPLVVSPRKTKLLNRRPTLRWTPLQNDASYSVGIQGAGVSWRRTVVAASHLAYPDDEPDLVPGKTYNVVVTSGTLTSENERVPGLGFTVLTPVEAEEVHELQRRIHDLNLPALPTNILLANMYISRRLYADAFELLEVTRQEAREPVLTRLLGEVYLALGVNCLAQQQYLEAVQASEQGNDREGRASAQYALGLIYASYGDRREAVKWLQQAKDQYQVFGDEKTVGSIQKRLASLE